MQIRTRLGLRICIGVLLSLAPAADEQCSPLHTHLPVVAHDSQGTSCASHMRQHVDAACYGRFATGRCGHRPLRGACFAVGAAIGRPRNDPPNTTRRCKFVPGWVADLHRRVVIVGPCCGRAMLAPTHRYALAAIHGGTYPRGFAASVRGLLGRWRRWCSRPWRAGRSPSSPG